MKNKKNLMLGGATCLAAAVVIGLIMTVSTFATSSNAFIFKDRINHQWGSWTFDGDSAVVENEGKGWNDFIVSDTYVAKEQEVYMKADVSFQAGNGTGFAFGMPYDNDPGAQWYSMNLWRDSETSGYMRVFAVNGPAGSIGDTHDYRYDLTEKEMQQLNDGSLTMEMRISNGGTIRGYLNGKCVVAVYDAGYQGGYLGFMICNANATYQNVEVEVKDAPSDTSVVVDSEGFTKINPSRDITNEWGTWYKDAEKVTAHNPSDGDLFAMFNIEQKENENLIFEAEVTRLGNTNCATLVFGVDNNANPGLGWYGLNIQYHLDIPRVRLYEVREKGTIGEDVDSKYLALDAEDLVNKTHKLRVESNANGKICVYLDGEKVADTYDSYFEGGYFGLCSFYGSFMFENMRYKLETTDGTAFAVEEQKYDVSDYRSRWQWGTWMFDDKTITGSNKDLGNHFAMSTLYVSPEQNFSFEADVLMDGISAGITFGVSQINDPIKGWYALAVQRDGGIVRLFSESKGTIGTGPSANLTEAQKKGEEPVNIRVEGFASGLIKAWVDGVLICEEIDDGWNGGYLGFNTFYANAAFSNIKFSISNNSQALKSLTCDKADLGFESNKYAYVSELANSVDTVTFTATVEDGYTVVIDGKKCTQKEIAISKAKSLVEVKVLDANDKVTAIYHIRLERFYEEQYRPGYHFTNKDDYMNDPNGLVYDSHTGLYHMFFQHHDGTTMNTPAQWGHAISKDLVNWTLKDIAIAPDENGYIYSGSCVVDEENTSGLFNNVQQKGSRLVAIFTYASDNPSIALAYSTDWGETWQKYGKVIANENNVYGNQFRDPKVIRVEDKWLMITGGWTNVRLYSSDDLVNWTLDSEVMDYYGNNLQTECPDIFPLPVDGDENNIKWVITTGGTSYVIGSLEQVNGKFVFAAEAPGYKIYNSPKLWTNRGDMYATQSYYNDKDGRRILVSWMIDSTVGLVDDKGWNGAQSLPLETKLVTKNGMIVMCSYPVEELNSMRKESLVQLNGTTLTESSNNPLAGINSNSFDLDMTIDVSKAKNIQLELCKGVDEQILLKYDVKSRVMKVVVNDANGVSKYKLPASVTPKDGKLTIRATFDKSILEVFVNEGEQSYHGFVFPGKDSTGMSLSVKGDATIVSLNAWEMGTMYE